MYNKENCTTWTVSSSFDNTTHPGECDEDQTEEVA